MNHDRIKPSGHCPQSDEAQRDPDAIRQDLATMIGQLLARCWLRQRAQTTGSDRSVRSGPDTNIRRSGTEP
jgi:hypothetical protein